MDDGQVGELRRWADGLTTDTRPEVKAAAKAILLLADDLEAARSQLLEERMIRQALEASEPAEVPVPTAVEGDEEEEEEEVEHDLRDRLRGFLQPARREDRGESGA